MTATRRTRTRARRARARRRCHAERDRQQEAAGDLTVERRATSRASAVRLDCLPTAALPPAAVQHPPSVRTSARRGARGGRRRALRVRSATRGMGVKLRRANFSATASGFPIRANEKHCRAVVFRDLPMTAETITAAELARARRLAIAADRRCELPVLDREPGPLGRRLASLPGDGHPGLDVCLWHRRSRCVAIASLSILAGLLVTMSLLHVHGVAADDESLVRFLARHRSSGLTDASLVGSIMAGGVVLPIIAGVAALIAAVARAVAPGGLPALALAVESASYRTTTLVVHRHRPEVHRLEKLPVDASYPSGHTAASIAVYGGIALLLTSRIENRAAKVAIWIVAALIPRVRRVLADVPRHAPPDRRRRRRDHRDRRARRARRRHARLRERVEMTRVAVIAHAGKTFGGGLPELRRELERQGVADPLWIEVPKSRFAPKQVKRALSDGAELLFVWGGDGMVQRAIDAMAGSEDAARDSARGHRQPARDEPRHPAGHRAGGVDRSRRRAPPARRGPVQRRALRGHGRRRLRRGDDRAGGRNAEGPARTPRLRLDRIAEPPSEAVQGEDRGRRRALVRRRRELHPLRQRRTPVRRHRGVPATPARTTAGSSSVSSTPTGSPTGCARSRAQPPGTRSARRSSRRRRQRRSRSSSTARFSTRWTAAAARRSRPSPSRCSPPRSRSASRGRSGSNGNSSN